jgi:kinesin family protein 18/19
MAELFQKIEERREDYTVDVSLSFLEIYNEEIRDLLAPASADRSRGGLAIREDSTNRITVAGLTELVPTSADEVNSIVQAGNARRTQSPTHANATSSRSHAVLQVNVTQSPRTPGVTEERTMATLSIIDLAGSERASATKNMGKRMVEGANINKSLLALGNCINALCEPRTRAHIPYRNSKLTRLLKFSLGGNCRTVMIVCVAPTSAHIEDTGNTLAYANRAKEIKTKVSKNFMDVDRHVGQYVEAINRLNDEVRELKAKLAGEVALENEAVKRRRLNAAKAVETARSEIRALATKSKTMLCTGSFTASNIAASHAKLEVMRMRLREIDAMSELTSDLEAEKGLLDAVVAAEEQVVKKEADTVSRASNTSALFHTNLGLAVKRKGDDWDESAPVLLKMEGDVALAEMRAAQAEHERDGLKQALTGQAKLIASLIGMLARSNTLVGDGAEMLQNLSTSSMTAEEIATRLQTIVEINNKAFTDVVGVATKSVSSTGKTAFATLKFPPSKRTSLSGNTTALRPRTSGGNRRTSLNGMGSPGRRGHGMRSPRRASAMRPGLSNTVHRKVVAEKKSVRWAVPINPDESYTAPQASSDDVAPGPVASQSLENEWEDDRTDDSLAIGNTSSASLSLDAAALSWSTTSASSSRPSPHTASALGVSGRRMRMDTESMKLKSPLSSLEEEKDTDSTPRRVLGDYNQLASTSKSLSNGSRLTASASKARRRSNVGPVRNDHRARRRSSLIPQLSPIHRDSGNAAAPQSAPMKKSPKKPKRSSLLGALTGGRIRPSLLKIGVETPTSAGAKPSWK